jgi:hypothetical protein
MCLQLPALTTSINIEIAPKKKTELHSFRHRVPHMKRAHLKGVQKERKSIKIMKKGEKI